MAGTVINLDQYDTRELMPLEVRGAGVYTALMMIRGNSLLSSVYVKSITPGATLKVNYFDTTTGTVDLFERYELNGHALITDTGSGETYRELVTRIHNKPQAEVIVTGGSVEFGVYISVVSDFPFESAPPAAGGFEPAEGVPGQLKFSGVTDQALVVPMLSAVVPVGVSWRLRELSTHVRTYGVSKLTVDGVEKARLISSPSNENARFYFQPYFTATAGQLVEVKYQQSHGPVSDIAAFLQYTVN